MSAVGLTQHFRDLRPYELSAGLFEQGATGCVRLARTPRDHNETCASERHAAM